MYCGNAYSVEELTARENRLGASVEGEGEASSQPQAVRQPKMDTKGLQRERKHATMKMQILHCNACGAELAVNDVEVSSFCAYCGQATVVLDRVDEYLRPDYIIPFQVTKEEAEETIRSKISSGFYVPDEIKHFEVEKLRGIYVPFWLYDILYGDEQFWKYTVKRGKSTVTRYSHRVADCHYVRLTADASRNLSDASSQRLEPYDMEELQSFQPMYLSGFYADRFDMGQEDTKDIAIYRAKEMFNESVKKTVRPSAKMVYTSPIHEVTGAEYALLPAWFLTFRQDGMPYTVLVNGQTKKMVGAVPCVKWKAWLTFAILAVILCGLLVPGSAMIVNYLLLQTRYSSDSWKMVLYIIVGAIMINVWVWRSAIKKYRAFKESVALTRSGNMSRFVRERQDKSWIYRDLFLGV